MKPSLKLALLGIATLSLACAADQGDWWRYKSFKGAYLIYSGSLGDEQPPTASDRKVSFSVSGSLAKEMFDAMPPDAKAKDACSSEKGHYERYKGNVSCVRDPDGYTCHFGFNLHTGGSISGATC